MGLENFDALQADGDGEVTEVDVSGLADSMVGN